MCFTFRFQQLFTPFHLTKLQPRAAVRRHPQVLSTLLLALGLAGWSPMAQACPTATLSWKASPEANIAGYRIYLGTKSGNLPQIGDAGNATSNLLTSLEPATTYYCAVQSYNTAGLASPLSSEIRSEERRVGNE